VTPPATSPLSQQQPLGQQQQQQQQTQPWQVGDACINMTDGRSSAILEEEPMRNAVRNDGTWQSLAILDVRSIVAVVVYARDILLIMHVALPLCLSHSEPMHSESA